MLQSVLSKMLDIFIPGAILASAYYIYKMPKFKKWSVYKKILVLAGLAILLVIKEATKIFRVKNLQKTLKIRIKRGFPH